LLPWPGAYTGFRGQALHIWKTRVAEARAGAAGELRRVGKSLLAVCGDGTAVELIELQLEGKKRIGGEAFANGQRLQENETLGDLS
jgi:methionyl-tRNA formyltransferase